MREVMFIVFLSIFVSAGDLQYLTKYKVPETNFETVTTDFESDWDSSGLDFDDAVDKYVDLGFTFSFNNHNYTQVNISSNGVLYFEDKNNAEYSNTGIPHTGAASGHDAIVESIYPYWDDMNLGNANDGAHGTIKYDTLGDASNKHFVVSWDKVPHYSDTGSYSFQVVLYEDGAIRFRYDASTDANGDSNGGATIGVQEDGDHFDENSDNTAIVQTEDILYLPNPIDLTLPISSCTKENKIALTTYDTSGYGDSYPDSAAEYETWITDNAVSSKLFGGGHIDKIDVSSDRNNNPYQADDDEYYLAIFKGYIYFPDTGIYKFGIDGDDAVEVYIDNTLVTGWYGGHARATHATHVKYVNAESGYHKVEYHMQEKGGGDSYHLYWQPPSEDNIVIVPTLRYFHCIARISKVSCVINDPINNTTNPKRIPGATIRYAISVDNDTDETISNVIVEDDLSVRFDHTSIQNIQIKDGSCDCQGISSASNNGSNGSNNGVNPVKLDFDTVSAGATECGYFEVDIK